MRDPTVPQIYLAHWTRLRVFKVFGGAGRWKWWGEKLENFGTWSFMAKELQHQIFLDNELFAFERIRMFEFRLCAILWFHVFVWEWGQDFHSGCH